MEGKEVRHRSPAYYETDLEIRGTLSKAVNTLYEQSSRRVRVRELVVALHPWRATHVHPLCRGPGSGDRGGRNATPSGRAPDQYGGILGDALTLD